MLIQETRRNPSSVEENLQRKQCWFRKHVETLAVWKRIDQEQLCSHPKQKTPATKNLVNITKFSADEILRKRPTKPKNPQNICNASNVGSGNTSKPCVEENRSGAAVFAPYPDNSGDKEPRKHTNFLAQITRPNTQKPPTHLQKILKTSASQACWFRKHVKTLAVWKRICNGSNVGSANTSKP